MIDIFCLGLFRILAACPVFAYKYWEGVVPDPGVLIDEDKALLDQVEKGFDGVWELLMTKRTKEEQEYFSVLEKLTGITKENYNHHLYIENHLKRYILSFQFL